MAAGFTFLLAKIGAALAWIGSLFVEVFVALSLLGKDLVCWVLDGALSLVVSILSAFDFSAFASWSADWAGLPASTIDMMQAIGVSTALGIVVSALGIRFMLQLIPFVRLGS